MGPFERGLICRELGHKHIPALEIHALVFAALYFRLDVLVYASHLGFRGYDRQAMAVNQSDEGHDEADRPDRPPVKKSGMADNPNLVLPRKRLVRELLMRLV